MTEASPVQKINARLALAKWPTPCFPVSLPIQYKPQFVETSVPFDGWSVVVMGDGTRTYLARSAEEAAAFEREFPTIATLLQPDVIRQHLESIVA